MSTTAVSVGSLRNTSWSATTGGLSGLVQRSYPESRQRTRDGFIDAISTAGMHCDVIEYTTFPEAKRTGKKAGDGLPPPALHT